MAFIILLILQYKLVYGLFVVPIVTGFFSVLGMAIERFQVSEKNNDDIQNHLCILKILKLLSPLK